MNSYNGFTPEQRMKAYRWLQNEIKKERRTPPAGMCDACDSIGYTEHHSEDYSEPYGDHIGQYTLCYRCHMWVHCRFRSERGFKLYITYLKAGKQFSPFNGKDWLRFRKELEVMPVPSHSGTPKQRIPLLEDLLERGARLSG